jgi:CubicO group peptidase (beta-lactamase class C family)
MQRRSLLQASLGLVLTHPVLAAMNKTKLVAAAESLQQSVDTGLVAGAALYVRQSQAEFSCNFGTAKSEEASFLLGSISKPIAIAAVMSLMDQGLFALNDRVSKFIPEFQGDARETITMCQLMTHCSGLPDQVANNAELRSGHAGLAEFVKSTIETPLLFTPGSQYNYSSMAILLATEVARRLTGQTIAELVAATVYEPLGMKHSAMGVGQLAPASIMQCQVEHAAPESGGGDPATKQWDWNSSYWRNLGAPWGGAHSSAADIARFLDAFLHPQGKLLKPETGQLMIRNHNPTGLRPRGLGFDLGKQLSESNTSERTFGHSGSTGTLCWADPATDTVFVVLTTLPAKAVTAHPRLIASKLVAEAAS